MSPSQLLLAVCAAATLAIAAPRASAQGPATPPASSAATPWSARPVGAYSLSLALPDRTMNVDLTIADSSGTLTALFWPVGDHDGHEMHVELQGADLVLTAQAPRGPVRIVLQRNGDKLSGTWSLGEEHGSLTGSVKSS